MRKTLFIMAICATIAAQAHAAQEVDVDKGDGGFGALKEHLINNRELRLLNIKKSVKCMELAADSTELDLCSKSAMREIKTGVDIFCQSALKGFQETSDYKVFCGNIAGKQSADAGAK